MCKIENLQKWDIVYSECINQDGDNFQKGIRPFLIISNNQFINCNTDLLNAIPLSTRYKPSPVHVFVEHNCNNGLLKNSYVLCEHITTISKARINRKVGNLRYSLCLLKEIENKIMFQFSLQVE